MDHCTQRRNHHLFKFLALAVACWLMLSGLHSVSSQPDSTPANGRIAFVSNRDGGEYQIYTMNADGTDMVRLTPSGDTDQNPRWSPDGRQIAFFSARNNRPGIYIMNADGTSVAQLSSSPDGDDFPSWSPDGEQIAFTRFSRNGADIYTMNTDGSEPTKIIDGADTTFNMMPTWSPDGRQIAFISGEKLLGLDTAGYFELKTVRLTNHHQIVLAALNEYGAPNWSWVTDKLTFYDLGTYYEVIQTINKDGTNRTTLTPQLADQPARADVFPAWSPDGQFIVFDSSVYSATDLNDADKDIYIMNADGSGIINLTPNNTANDIQPDWQPIPALNQES